MRVIHVACVAPPYHGGMGMAAYREVVLLRSRGVDAVLVAPERGDFRAAERSFVEPIRPRFHWGHAAILPDIERHLVGADLVHIHYPFYGTAEPLLLKKKTRPIVVTFHMDAKAPGLKGACFGLHRLFVQPFLLKKADRILISSLDYARSSSLQSFVADHPERVEELAFGVDADFFTPGPTKREHFHLPSDAFVILFVGGLDRAHAFKGVHVLLKAVTLLGDRAHVLIVGEGELKEAYQDHARKLGIAHRSHFVGRVDEETLRDAYRSADVHVLPSVSGAEAFGLVALEAQACGVPVVASDLPGVRTVVRHRETGWLVPPGNADALASALLDAQSDRETRIRFGQAAREHAERYSWDRHVEGLMEIYQGLCASPS